MESNHHSYDDNAEEEEEEDYIDMDVNVNSETTIFIHTKTTTSPQFEFQMSTTTSSEKDFTLASPADELFYKGKLLPLHLPPRLQMVEKLLQNTSTFDYKLSNTLNDSFTTTPLFTAANNSPSNNNTPFQSCTISPNESVQVSRELNPEEYFSDYSSHTCKLVLGENQKKSWTKKLSFGSKLKASRSYLKSFFSKSGCSKENSVSASRTNFTEEEGIFKTKEAPNMFAKMPKKHPFGHIQQRSPKQENLRANHRRSFSGVIKRISIQPRSSSTIFSSGSASSSSSSSTNSNGLISEKKERHKLKRSNSVGSDMENPIQAAIAHCKKSQDRIHHSRKGLSNLGFCKLSTAALVKYEDQRLTVCRG